MRIDKKKVLTLFALTLLITSLLLLSMNGRMGATEPVKTGSRGTSGLGSSPNPIVVPDPTEIVIPFCETGDIAICVENFTGVASLQFKIWWLKDVVNFTGYEWKPYPPEWPTPLTAGPLFEENATHKSVAFGITSVPPTGFSYAGRWPFIDTYWHCLRPGVDSPLIFDRDSTMLFDEFGEPIPIEKIIDGLIINPGPPEIFDVELYPRKVVDLPDPTSTQWHELHPNKSNFYHLKSWEPGMVLSPEDQIDMYAIDPPVKIYLESISPFDPFAPICTEWHELDPFFSQIWHLSSWEDNNGDGYLSPCDQIDMTNMDTGEVVWFHVQFIDPPGPEPGPRMMHLDVKYWFQVDEVTVDMTLSPTEPGPQIFVEYKCGYWTFDPENPISTKWNEIDPVLGPVRCLHLTSWNDTGEPFGELSYSDTIDMTPMHPTPGPVEYYHVDWMSISLKLSPKPSPPVVPPPPTFGPVYLDSMISYDEFNLTNPVCTKWFEIYPVYGTIWHLSSWEDTLGLSPSDQIVLQLKDPVTHEPIPCTDVEYHVDKVTVAMNLTSEYDFREHIVKFEGSLKQFKMYHWTEPISTQWHEVNPDYCRQWHIVDWLDSGMIPGYLDYCDYILMIDKETGWIEEFHVESLSTDMWLTEKPPPPPPPPPEDLELYPREVVDLEDPTGTQWHELHPVKSNFYQIISWEPGMVLSPEDLVQMDGLMFQVDEVTIGLVVYDELEGMYRWLYYECGYWIFKKDVWTDPECSKWIEIKNDLGPVLPQRCWHLTSWMDDGDGKLGFCDFIDMTPMLPYPDPPRSCHVEWVTVMLKLTEELAPLPLVQYYLMFEGPLEEFQDMDYIHNPWTTPWHEVLPLQSRPWMLTEWIDQPYLSPSDQIVLQLKDPVTHEPIPCTEAEYHVDKLTVAMNLTSIDEPGVEHIVKYEGSLQQFKKYHWGPLLNPDATPVSTQWHEVNPDYCRQWHIMEWIDDNGDGILDYCDYILMIDKETGDGEMFHVESLSTDMWVTQKICSINITDVVTMFCNTYPVDSGFTLWTIQVKVTAHNNGTIPINCNVNAYYYNATTTVLIGTQPITNLAPCNTITLTFNWNLAGLTQCKNYTVKANATCTCETGSASDQFVKGDVYIRRTGDIDGSGVVSWGDKTQLGLAWLANKGDPNYNCYADIDGSGTVSWGDKTQLGINWLKGCP